MIAPNNIVNDIRWHENAEGDIPVYKPVRPFYEVEELEDENADFLESIYELDFSDFSGKPVSSSLKELNRKMLHKTNNKKSSRIKRKTVNEVLLKEIPVKRNATIFSNNGRGISKVIVPKDKTLIVQGASKFVLDESKETDCIKNINYYKGEKLKELVLIFNNTSPIDLTLELFNPSAQMDYFFSNSQNINDRISVAGNPDVAYTDVVYNMLANPTHIVNAKFIFAGDSVANQFNKTIEVKNKEITAFEKISPINVSLQKDTMQVQGNQVCFTISDILGRPFIPDGMDVMKYTVLAGMTVVMAFYYRQVSLKKEFFKEAADSRILL